MIDASEHFYDDDPQRGPDDVRTRLEGASYFFLGNGLIQAAVQFAPAGDGTPLGLLIMSAERFGKKRDALTLHGREGLAPTIVRVILAGVIHRPEPAALSVEWARRDGVPAVRARWESGDVRVEECFFCPDRRNPVLAREVSVRLAGGCAAMATLVTGSRTARHEHRISIPAGGDARSTLLYRIGSSGKRAEVEFSRRIGVSDEARGYWEASARADFGDPLLNRFFAGSATQLPASVSASGRVDGSIWQYNREWVRDQAFVAVALTMIGHRNTAAIMLRRLLGEFIKPDGSAVDSSEVRGRDEAELDQNGVLLYALQQYVSWTGDTSFITSSWDRITVLAEYPLREEFYRGPSGMPGNVREFWERHRIHGIAPGMELAQQLFISIGLASAAAFARMTGHHSQAARWAAYGERLKRLALEDPLFALVDERGLIKRRGFDGKIEESITPLPNAQLPAGVPLLRPGAHPLNPDTSAVLPIAFGFIPPDGDLARRTLQQVELLWNQEWTGGGYGRYHAASEPDSVGPWPFASVFVARAAIEAGDMERAWRVLRWLETVAGAAACSWFEFYGRRFSPPFPQVGVIPWMWAELLVLFIHHVLGVRPSEGGVRIRPRLLPGLEQVAAAIPLREGWLHLQVRAEAGRTQAEFRSDAAKLKPCASDAVFLPWPSRDTAVEAVVPA